MGLVLFKAHLLLRLCQFYECESVFATIFSLFELMWRILQKGVGDKNFYNKSLLLLVF